MVNLQIESYSFKLHAYLERRLHSRIRELNPYFKTAAGAEIDLVLTKGKKQIAVECKASSAPEVGKGFWSALRDLGIKEAWIVAPVKETYPIEKNVIVTNLGEFLAKIDRARQQDIIGVWYQAIIKHFEALGIAASDVIIVLNKVALDNWDIRGGQPRRKSISST